MSIAIKRNFTIPATSSIGASEISLTSSTASTSVETGAIVSLGGAGISGAISLGGPLKLYNGSYYTAFDSAATASTTYVWPATSPSTGTSVLSSDAAGNLSWILMSASGSGLTLNGLDASIQYFSTSISGSGFTISSFGSTHTFHIGLAGSASTGLISGTAQTIAGQKTFTSTIIGDLSGTATTATTAGSAGTSVNAGFAGAATTATNAGFAGSSTNTANINITLDTTSTIYLTGSRSNASIGSTPIYVLSGVSALGNTITATTFSGTATTATNTANTNIVLDTTSTIYLTGSRSNASIGSTPVYVLSGVSALGNTITATTFTGSLSGTASSAALVNVAASTGTRYLAGCSLNTATGSTQLFTGSGITIGDNRLTTGGLAVTSGTASTNTTTGALTVAGGVGITGQLSVNTIALGSTGVSATPSMTYVGTAGTVISMSVLSDTTLAWEGSSGQLFSIDNNLSSGEIFSVSDISGLPVITASAGQTITLNEFGGYTQVGNGLASTSTTTGALRVIGGVGVTGAVYIAGNTSVLSSTASTSTSTGALTVTGGVGIGASVNIAGNTNITSSTASTSTTTGALVVTGGVGVGASVNVAGNINITSSVASTTTSTGALVVSGGVGIGGTINIGGNVRVGSNTFTKSGFALGDVLLDNGSTDTPAVLFYWGNNKNIGLDTYYPGTGTTKFRIVKELNESGGTELWSVDRNGIVTQTAWDVGETVNTRMYDYNELNMSATTTIGITSYVRIANLTYTPKSSSSYIWIEFNARYDFNNGTTVDDYWANITVNGTEIAALNQIFVNGSGGGTRSGTLFPISARYTNSGTSGIAITVQGRRGSADDDLRVYGSSTSGYMRIQEIGR